MVDIAQAFDRTVVRLLAGCLVRCQEDVVTIAVIHRQPFVQDRARRGAAVRCAPSGRPPGARPDRAGAPTRRPAAGPLRWTARGRVVVRAVTAAALTAVVLAVVAAAVLVVHRNALAGTGAGRIAVRYHVVLPGETLWGIAAEEAPGSDRREAVARIVEVNALNGSRVFAGQRLAIPAG